MIKQRAVKGRNRADRQNLYILYIGRIPTQVMIVIRDNFIIVYLFNLISQSECCITGGTLGFWVAVLPH